MMMNMLMRRHDTDDAQADDVEDDVDEMRLLWLRCGATMLGNGKKKSVCNVWIIFRLEHLCYAWEEKDEAEKEEQQ